MVGGRLVGGFNKTHLSLGVFVSLSTASEVFCGEFLVTFVILISILLTIKSPVASAFFEAVLSASVVDCLAR